MGTIKRGVLGGFSGKVANVVGGSWKGIATMRSLPLSVANPRTAGQVQQRGKLALLVLISKALLVGIIKPLNDRFATRMSGYNRWVQMNIAAVNDNGTLNRMAFKISEGALENTTYTPVTPSEGDTTVQIDWNDNSGTGSALGSDLFYAAVYNSTQDKWYIDQNGLNRQATSATIDVDQLTEGDQISFYMTFLSEDGKKVATSVHYSRVVTA
jgi:hypothetical protein